MKMKKLFAVLLSVMMLLAIGTTAFATSGTNGNTGKITITNPVVGETYSVYQMFVLESYNSTEGSEAYAYTITSESAWYGFVSDSGAGASYVTLEQLGTTGTYYVTWNEITNETSGHENDDTDALKAANDAAAADFAKLALAYAQDSNNKVTKTAYGTLKTETDASTGDKTTSLDTTNSSSSGVGYTDSNLVFSSLNLGYYLVDSSLGALVMLNTTNPTVEIQEKNTPPTVEKKVQEDSTSQLGESNTAQIGDTVTFQTTISAKKGAQNYVLHDTMSEGLTFSSISSVKVGETTLKADTQYTVKTNDSTDTGKKTTDGCTFEIVFSQDYLDTITEDTSIIVTYTAILNDKAVVSTGANTNKTHLTYGEGSKTTEVGTETYTFEFDIVKTDSSNKLLDGAKFELYDAATDGNKINLVAVDSDNDGTAEYYRVATAAESSVTDFKSAVIEATNGKATVIGLDAGTTYWLEETAAPNGYNKLASRTEVKIEEENLTTTMEATATEWKNGDGGVHITNNTGSELPSTGGIGTTIFYIVGSLLVVGAVIFFVVRRRMRAEEQPD